MQSILHRVQREARNASKWIENYSIRLEPTFSDAMLIDAFS